MNFRVGVFVKSAAKTVVLFWKFMFMKQKCDNEKFSCISFLSLQGEKQPLLPKMASLVT